MINKPTVPYEEATGSPKYGLTNDYIRARITVRQSLRHTLDS